MDCAFYVMNTYQYDVVFTDVGPAIRTLIRKGFEHSEFGHLQIFDDGKYLYECVVR